MSEVNVSRLRILIDEYATYNLFAVRDAIEIHADEAMRVGVGEDEQIAHMASRSQADDMES